VREGKRLAPARSLIYLLSSSIDGAKKRKRKEIRVRTANRANLGGVKIQSDEKSIGI